MDPPPVHERQPGGGDFSTVKNQPLFKKWHLFMYLSIYPFSYCVHTLVHGSSAWMKVGGQLVGIASRQWVPGTELKQTGLAARGF